MADGGELAPIMGDVARLLWGDPNKALSTRHEWRWGKHGSRSIKIEEGVWFDNEQKVGGGVLDLIARETGQKGRDAFAWLHEHGFDVGRDQTPRRDQRAQAPRQSDQDRPAQERKPATGNHPPGIPADAKLVATFDYVDETGALIFQVVRYEFEDKGRQVKTFRQRRRDGDQWVWSVKGVKQVPYRVGELQEAVSQGLVVFVVEGEKCVERLAREGVPATCNAMGAGKWFDELNPFFAGADVVIIPDNDPQLLDKDGKPKFHDDGRPVRVGHDHAQLVARNLYDYAKQVRILELPGLGDKEDVFDWIEKGNDPAALYDLVETKAVAWTPEANWKSRFGAVTWAHLDDPGPEHEWLIKGLLTRGERSMCAGESQAGKSFLALDMALAIARGVDFFGMRTRRGGVVYQAGEGGRGIKKRLRAYRRHNDLRLDADVPFVLLPSPVDLYGSEDHTDLLIEEIHHWSKTFSVPLELVVIDTLSAATPGANENASEDMSQVLSRCAKIAKLTNAHVMLVHHMNASGAKPRGHTSILANLENVIIIRRIEGLRDGDGRAIREAEVAKQKDGESGERVRFVLASVQVGVDSEGDPVTSCVCLPPAAVVDAAGETKVDVSAERLSPQCITFLQAIKKAIDEHGEPPLAALHLPRSVRVVRGERVREIFERMTFEGEGEADEKKKSNVIRQAMKRHGEALLARGVIGRANPFIWLTGKPVRGFRTPTTAGDNVVQLHGNEGSEVGGDDELPIL